ncbi:MAG: 30S ribosomal protein S8 [bacterium]|nr:30S ribosomal protein S8 [bacterium]
MNYLVSDFIIRIKNACLAKRHTVVLPYSKITKEIGKTLIREGYLKDIEEKEDDGKKFLAGIIKYKNRKPVLTDVEIVSKPSLRVYSRSKSLSKGRRGVLGSMIVSTSSGVMTEKEAKKKGVGGEILFKVW